jgi:hypothetical protein
VRVGASATTENAVDFVRDPDQPLRNRVADDARNDADREAYERRLRKS